MVSGKVAAYKNLQVLRVLLDLKVIQELQEQMEQLDLLDQRELLDLLDRVELQDTIKLCIAAHIIKLQCFMDQMGLLVSLLVWEMCQLLLHALITGIMEDIVPSNQLCRVL